jgi:uncharacterized membrane protein YagU involved in acid resistance
MHLINSSKIAQLIKAKKRTASVYLIFGCIFLSLALMLGIYLDIEWCLFLVRHYAVVILWAGAVMGLLGWAFFFDEQTPEEKLREEKLWKQIREYDKD